MHSEKPTNRISCLHFRVQDYFSHVELMIPLRGEIFLGAFLVSVQAFFLESTTYVTLRDVYCIPIRYNP